mgnify:CR=1 FL=1
MPLHDLGGGCYKYGNAGKKFCGAGAKRKAIRQGLAESYSQTGGPDLFKSEMKSKKHSKKAKGEIYFNEEEFQEELLAFAKGNSKYKDVYLDYMANKAATTAAADALPPAATKKKKKITENIGDSTNPSVGKP